MSLEQGSAGPEVRLPLQIGTTSLWSLGRVAIVLVPALVLAPLMMVAIDDVEGALGVLALGGMLLIYGASHARFAWRERASDVLLGPRGLRIEGGRFHGLWALWENVDRGACRLVDVTERRFTLGGILLASVTRFRQSPLRDVPVLRLELVPRHGPPLVVAQAERPIEMESLRALLDSIRTGPWGEGASQVQRRMHEARARQAQLGIRVVACGQCGAAVAPAEQQAVKCRYCGASVPIPPEVAHRLTASRRVSAGRAATHQLVHKLLHQPGAHETNSRMALLGAPMLLAWPLVFSAYAARYATDSMTVLDELALPLVPFLVVGGLFALSRAKLVDRQALRLLTVDFGAQPPLREGDPHGCRRCGAPLDERPGELVATCSYCQCDNVLGLDLGRDVAPTEHQAQTLEQALGARASEARLWGALKVVGVTALGLGLAGLGLGAGGSLLVATEDDPAPRVAPPAPIVAPPPPRAPHVAPTPPPTPRPAPKGTQRASPPQHR